MIRTEATEPMHADSGPLKTWQQTVRLKTEEFRINLSKGKCARKARKRRAKTVRAKPLVHALH